jgi:hypothetical protein
MNMTDKAGAEFSLARTVCRKLGMGRVEENKSEHGNFDSGPYVLKVKR